MRGTRTEARCSITLDAEALAAFEVLAKGRSRASVVREALLRAADMERALAPILTRLDRIEAALRQGGGSPTVAEAPAGLPEVDLDAIAASLTGFGAGRE